VVSLTCDALTVRFHRQMWASVIEAGKQNRKVASSSPQPRANKLDNSPSFAPPSTHKRDAKRALVFASAASSLAAEETPDNLGTGLYGVCEPASSTHVDGSTELELRIIELEDENRSLKQRILDLQLNQARFDLEDMPVQKHKSERMVSHSTGILLEF